MNTEWSGQNVLVIGGRGYFGGRVVAALRAAGADVCTATRSPREGEIRVDLRDSATFGALDAALIINCSDTIAAPPDAAIAHVCARGGTWVETTDEADTVLRLLKRYRSHDVTERDAMAGRLLIGLGIMPGLSNLAASALAARCSQIERMEVAIRLNPLSGAGAGMNALSARLLANVARRFENGELIVDPPAWFGPLVPFGAFELPVLRMGLPEAVMLGYSGVARSTASYFSTGLPFAQGAMLGASLLMPKDPVFKPLAVDAIGGALNTVRSTLFRSGITAFDIVAMANRRDAFRHDGPWLRLRINDGMAAAVTAVAVGVAMLQQHAPASGAYLPDELFTLDEMLERVQAIAGKGLRIERGLHLGTRRQPVTV